MTTFPASPSYARGATSPPLLEQTIGENLRRTVERFRRPRSARRPPPGLPRDLRASCGTRSTARPRALLARGVRKGDRVGIWAPNRYEWVVTQFATARVGAILVTINPAYQAAELEYALRQGRRQPARAWPAASAAPTTSRCCATSRDSCPALREAIVLEDDWEALPGRRATRSATRELAAREATLQLDDPINIQYTSGTTGAPKGATLSHRNILNNALLHRPQRCGYTEHDRVCVPVPLLPLLRHGARHPRRASTHGACMVVPGEAFDPRAVLAAVEAERCTSLYGVPTMFIAELDHPDFDALRPVEPAHRHDGRRAVPGRGDAAGARRACTWTRSRSSAA